MGQQRTRTRDGLVEWLACDGGAMCQGVVLGITSEDGFWASLARMGFGLLGITGEDGFWASPAMCLCLSSISLSLSLFARLSPKMV